MKSDIAGSDASGQDAGSVASAAAAGLTGEDLARAKARLRERVSAARGSIAVAGEKVSHRARKTTRDTNHYVHEHPWQAVGIGATLGLLIGIFAARRN